MRLQLFAFGLLHLVSVAGDTTGIVSQVAVNGHDLLIAMPLCAQECATSLDCTLDISACYCTNEALLAVEACARSNCTVRQAFVAKQNHRTVCEVPARSDSSILVRSIWTLFAVSALAVLLRFIARSTMTGGVGVGWDDWVILVCLAPLLSTDIMLNMGAGDGLGKDIWTLPPARINSALRYLWITVFTYTAVLVGVQVSITLFYIRIFGEAHRTFRAVCIGVIALCICSGLTACIGALFYCSRIPLFWEIWDNEHTGTCRTAHAQIYTMAGINIFLDLLILSLPVPKLRNLHVSLARKIGLIATFLVGIFATCSSIVRLRYLVVWGNTMNPTWDYSRVAAVSSYECHLAVICACMPSMAGLWKRFLKRKKASELQKSRSTPLEVTTSKEALCQGVELTARRPRGSSVRVTTSLAEFLATVEGASSSDLELTQRGIDHANAEIARIKALGR